MVTKKSRGLGNMDRCPQCGCFGQIKRRLDKKSKSQFFQVDHYAEREHKHYISSCYIGTATPDLEKQLFKLSKDRRVLTRRFQQ